jgi:hypothetical protein
MAMRTRTLLISSLLILLVALLAFGQTMHLKAKVPFAFTVSGKVLPAGQYDVSTGTNFETIQVRGSDAGAVAIVPVMTRLGGALHTTPQDSHLVFDRVGDNYTLSEVWGLIGDGYLVFATKGKHEHAVVNVPK